MKLYNSMLKTHGYINETIPKDINLKQEILNLKQEKNAIILGHFYLVPELQDISDILGDSLKLSQEAAKTNADIIVFMGVHFMAETAKIISPNKKVLLPDLKAGCSLADSAPVNEFIQLKKQYPNHLVINYINCTAELKTVSDIVCTSSNAVPIIKSVPDNQPIIFGPDKNMGNYLNSITGKNMVLWDGSCIVHDKYSLKGILKLKSEYPAAKIIAHPECEAPVLRIADFIGSTSQLLKYSKEMPDNEFIVATESGILHQMTKFSPNKKFIPAPALDASCGCNDCEYMKLNTIEKLYLCLKYELPEVVLSDEVILKAKKPIDKMLEISKKLGL